MPTDWQSFVIIILLSILGFLLSGVAKKIEKNTEVLNEFSVKLSVLTAVVDNVKGDYKSIRHDIDRLDGTNEMIRRRIHKVANVVSGLKLKLEVSNLIPRTSDINVDDEDDDVMGKT